MIQKIKKKTIIFNFLSTFSIERVNGIPLWDFYLSDFQGALKIKIIAELFIVITISQGWLRLQLHGAIYRPDSFELMLRYYVNLKAIRYESTSLNRIVADKSHRVIVA